MRNQPAIQHRYFDLGQCPEDAQSLLETGTPGLYRCPLGHQWTDRKSRPDPAITLYACDQAGDQIGTGAILADGHGRQFVFLDAVAAEPGGVIRVGWRDGSADRDGYMPAAMLGVTVTALDHRSGALLERAR